MTDRPLELPRMLHQYGGVWVIVTTPEDCADKLAHGWHLRPPPAPDPAPTPEPVAVPVKKGRKAK